MRTSEITVRVPTGVALYILNQKRATLVNLESRYGFRVILEGDDTVVPPDIDIERVKYNLNLSREYRHGAPAPLRRPTTRAMPAEMSTTTLASFRKPSVRRKIRTSRNAAGGAADAAGRKIAKPAPTRNRAMMPTQSLPAIRTRRRPSEKKTIPTAKKSRALGGDAAGAVAADAAIALSMQKRRMRTVPPSERRSTAKTRRQKGHPVMMKVHPRPKPRRAPPLRKRRPRLL